MQVRIARHTERLDEVVHFYRDRLGLPEIGRFEGHDGYDGVFLAIPEAAVHLEFTSGGSYSPPTAHPETLLVLYLGSVEAVTRVCEQGGLEQVEAANPYWKEHGVTVTDPDGFRVVLARRAGPPQTSRQGERKPPAGVAARRAARARVHAAGRGRCASSRSASSRALRRTSSSTTLAGRG
jgi:catechol 2,3-dioxygenase-like lactoylglutathione lyase family enzyme